MISKKEILQNAIELTSSGKWDEAHDLVQNYEGDYEFDRIHALLHRIEGDDFNAKWWYRKLGIAYPSISIEDEIIILRKELL